MTSAMPAGLRTTTLAARPDLVDAFWTLPSTWAPFSEADPVGERLFGLAVGRSPGLQLLLLDEADHVLARLVATPFPWSGEDDDLPARGWDAVLERSDAAARRGAPASAVSLLEARVHPAHQGRGLSGHLVRAGRDTVRATGVCDLVAPVRPTGKTSARTTVAAHAAALRDDGLPVDPWLRTHVRAGGRVVGACPLSMTVPGTLAQWRAWTGLPFDASGDVEVPGALAPVHVDVEQDHAVYVEANVWVHHRLAR
ncbi:N-acetyltransferase [Pseudokineococcus lusitanus]|uniref:Acetyltransferase (GNAT) family protein n=1 Tax=Pseudokineococcus lusitanus TaxID=763993 RepID=A0A3N1HTN4_9ACTN|nr:N-acetyltransferase [Pseudokineococcus lusitanus]ROP45888.1 hypothetical protein EDC03_0500 [Pseudokineococcus lusitanus]